jgi:PAT family beta-lactamase induction signal transducer AmpG
MTTSPGAAPPRVPPAYFALFILLYAVQGVVFAYFVNFIQGYMLAGGLDDDTASNVQTIAMLPFVFKFLAGPVSDRYNLLGLGHRKPYIALGLIAQAAGLVLLSAVHPRDQLGLFGFLALLTVGGLALFDTCTDGMIVDITPPEDRSRVQGTLMFARFLTATVFAYLFGLWLERTGTGPGKGGGVLWACAGLTLLPLALTLVLREPSRSPLAERFSWKALAVLIRPRSLVLLAFGTFYAMVAWGVEINLPYYYEHLGHGQRRIGEFGAVRNLGRAAGGLLMPLGVAWLGRRWVLRVAVLALMASEAAQAIPGGPILTGALAFAFGAANGWTEALFYVLAMEASDPRLAASTYALFMAVSNLSVTGGSLFRVLSKAFGGRYEPTFVAAAMLTGFALILIRPLSRPPKAEPPEPEPAYAPAA